MPKSKLKINSKYLDKLGLDVSADELPTDACIKRVNFDSTLELIPQSDIDVVQPHIIGNKKDEFSVGIITTIDVDSDGDVVLPKGIDTSRYEKNPVVLFQHNLNMPIGYAEEITVHDDKITAKTRYGSTEEAKKVHQLLKDKVLRTHSIGFVTLESEVRGTKAFELILNDLKSMFPDKFDEETSKRVDRFVTKSLLLEYSIVTIPSNQEAVINEIKSIKNSEEKTKEIKEVSEEVKEITEEVIEEPKENIEEEVEENIEVKEIEEEVKEDKEDSDIEVKDIKDKEAALAAHLASEEIEVEVKKTEVKVIKRGSNIKKISTLEEREQQKLKNAYMKLWGI